MSQPYPGDGSSYPPPPNYQPVPPPGYPPAAPGGQLILNLRKPSGLGSSAMITPVVHIDGYPAPAHWEQNAYPVPAGSRKVTVDSRYLWSYGRQEMLVDVAPGQSAEVFYTGPLVSFGAGAMGYEPQKRPGQLAFALLLTPIALILVLTVIFAMVGN